MDQILTIALAGAVGGASAALLYQGITKINNSKIRKPVPEEARIDILRQYSDYDCTVKVTRKTAMLMDRPAPDILQKYGYDEYLKNTASDGKDAIVFSMLDFVCDRFGHLYNAVIKGRRSLTNIIRNCERADMKTNCRGLSHMLAELLRMNGVKARPICCKPYEQPFSDCHVVVDCLLPSGGRVMLDPTYRLYLTDGNGEYVSIRRLRECILSGETLNANAEASYNGEGFDLDDYLDYMSKNCLRFNTNLRLDESDLTRNEVELIPKGYSIEGYPRSVQYVTDPDSFWEFG